MDMLEELRKERELEDERKLMREINANYLRARKKAETEKQKEQLKEFKCLYNYKVLRNISIITVLLSIALIVICFIKI